MANARDDNEPCHCLSIGVLRGAVAGDNGLERLGGRSVSYSMFGLRINIVEFQDRCMLHCVR